VSLFGVEPAVAVIRVPEVEIPLKLPAAVAAVADGAVVLAHVAGEVARLLELHGVRHRPGLGRDRGLAAEVHAVAALPLAKLVTHPAGRAQRAGAHRVVEADPVGGQGVEVRRLQERMAGAAQVGSAVVFGQNDHEIGGTISHGGDGKSRRNRPPVDGLDTTRTHRLDIFREALAFGPSRGFTPPVRLRVGEARGLPTA